MQTSWRDEEKERKSQLGFSFIVRMNNLALFCLVVKIEKERGGTCREGVLITEERSRLGASPGVEQQKGQAVLEGLYSPGDQRGTARPRTGNRLVQYISLKMSHKAEIKTFIQTIQ